MKLSRDSVILAYRYILGRDPESEAVIQHHMNHVADEGSLRDALLSCDEFTGGRPGSDQFMQRLSHGYSSERGRIDVEVSAPITAELVDRIKRQWSLLGEEEPYWGVLTDERYKSATIDDQALATFRESGRATAAIIDAAQRRGLRARAGGTCVELGCGVGRITRHLADRFDRVIAADISPGNLRLCAQYMQGDGIPNVQPMLLTSLDDLESLEPMDWFFSMIVLQHNSPPVQHQILEIILPKIKAGGGFVFQTVSDLPGYQFVAADYLKTVDPVMEIHALPQEIVFQIVEQAGLRISAARMDPWISGYGSYTYEGYRP